MGSPPVIEVCENRMSLFSFVSFSFPSAIQVLSQPKPELADGMMSHAVTQRSPTSDFTLPTSNFEYHTSLASSAIPDPDFAFARVTPCSYNPGG